MYILHITSISDRVTRLVKTINEDLLRHKFKYGLEQFYKIYNLLPNVVHKGFKTMTFKISQRVHFTLIKSPKGNIKNTCDSI